MDNENVLIGICKQCLSKRVEHKEDLVCQDCKFVNLFTKLSMDSQEAIDEMIVTNRILYGLKRLGEDLNLDLRESLEIYYWRYDKLRESRPQDFTLSTDEYWKGFIS